MTRRRTVIAALVVALVAAAGVGGLFVRREMRQAAACDFVRDAVARFGDQPVGAGPRSVDVLGDSYSIGLQLDDPRANAWPAVVGQRLGARVAVRGYAGSGFATSSPCRAATAYMDRVGSLPGGASLTIVQGGLNDLGATGGLERAAEAVIAAAPGRVVVVGPPPAPQVTDRATLAKVDATLAAAAKAEGATYVSALGWTDLDYRPDGLHLTAAGHEDFGTRLAAALDGKARRG